MLFRSSSSVSRLYLRQFYDRIKDIISANFADNNRGLDNIIKNIKHYITSLPHVGSKLPKTWTRVQSSYHRLQVEKLIPCNCSVCENTQNPYLFKLNDLEERRRYQRETIECGKPPFNVVKVQELIDDIMNISKDKQSQAIRNQIFISYSRRDGEWLEKLRTHLIPLIREKNIKIWDDTQIPPGSDWQKEINKALATAKIALLLVSPDFLASDFINREELPYLLEASEAEGLTIFWIPVRPSLYEETKIKNYQAAHDPKYPLSTLTESEQEQSLVKICQKLKKVHQS